ncbi:MAG: endonuclease III [Nitrospinota bacterium]|nr:endonuclease III [Nitrospinota bacterium]
MDSKTVNKLFKKLSLALGNAKSELDYKNHFELLIAVILSAQSTDKTVNVVTKKLFLNSPTPKDVLLLGQKKLQSIIKPVGLSPTKSKNIISTCKILIKKYQGNIPNKREELEYLPGVGRKTANVILNEGFGYPTIAVDTHVFRVSNRTGLALGKNVLDTEKELLRVTPEKWAKNAHHYLILHGRYVCKARKFDCKQCVINKECEYPEKN